MHDASGGRYVLKIYPAGGSSLSATEEFGLRLAAEAGVPVPRAVLSGVEPSTGRAYLLMTRLPGVRWADRRGTLSTAELRTLTADTARALRRLHDVRGTAFGRLSGDGRRWPTVSAMVESLSGEWLREFSAAGGSPELAGRLRRLVSNRRAVLESGAAPALCHNDFIDGNLVVADAGPPHLSGVVDFERASWNDPMSDLAQTRVHVAFHDPDGVAVLTDAYGCLTADERQRVGLYEVLHRLRERNWIAYDRPPGWPASVAKLDALLAQAGS
jgi:aminoglycoside phosphotransferase (APT) family kinase protein